MKAYFYAMLTSQLVLKLLYAICTSALLVSHPDKYFKLLIVLRAFRGFTVNPRVITTPRYFEGFTDCCYRETVFPV
jgi:hypothetical protein